MEQFTSAFVDFSDMQRAFMCTSAQIHAPI
jgi:hypothetical protein